MPFAGLLPPCLETSVFERDAKTEGFPWVSNASDGVIMEAAKIMVGMVKATAVDAAAAEAAQNQGKRVSGPPRAYARAFVSAEHAAWDDRPSIEQTRGGAVFAMAMALMPSTGEFSYGQYVEARAAALLASRSSPKRMERMALACLEDLQKSAKYLGVGVWRVSDCGTMLVRRRSSPREFQIPDHLARKQHLGPPGSVVVEMPFEYPALYSRLSGAPSRACCGVLIRGHAMRPTHGSVTPLYCIAQYTRLPADAPLAQAVVLLAGALVRARGDRIRKLLLNDGAFHVDLAPSLRKSGKGSAAAAAAAAAGKSTASDETTVSATPYGNGGEGLIGGRKITSFADVWPAEGRSSGIGNASHTTWMASGPEAHEDIERAARAAHCVVRALGGDVTVWKRVMAPLVEGWSTIVMRRACIEATKSHRYSEDQRADYMKLAKLVALSLDITVPDIAPARDAEVAAAAAKGNELYDLAMQKLFTADLLALPPCVLYDVYVRRMHPKHSARMAFIGLMGTLDFPTDMALQLYYGTFARDSEYQARTYDKRHEDTVEFFDLFGDKIGVEIGGGMCATRARYGACPAVDVESLVGTYRELGRARKRADAKPDDVEERLHVPRSIDADELSRRLEWIRVEEADSDSRNNIVAAERCACARAMDAERIGTLLGQDDGEIVIHARQTRIKHPRQYVHETVRGAVMSPLDRSSRHFHRRDVLMEDGAHVFGKLSEEVTKLGFGDLESADPADVDGVWNW